MSLSPDLVWACINKHNSFLVKRNGVTFSSEPGNLTNVHSYKFSGLANRTAVDIQAGKEKGAVLSLKNRYGRRPGLIASYVLGVISLLLLSHLNNILFFVILLAISGFGLSPYLTNSFLLLNESSGTKMRANSSVIINWFWTFGQILVGILAYVFDNDWKSLVFYGVGLPLLLIAPFVVIWTRESPM